MKKNYFFFTEGRPIKNISFGHFFRSYEAAKFLKKKGYKCFFVIKDSKYVKKYLDKINFKIINPNKFKKKDIYKDKSILVFDKFSLTNFEINSFKYYKKIIFDDYNRFKNKNNCLILRTNLSKREFRNYTFNSYNFRLLKFLNLDEKKSKIKKKNILIFLGGSDIKDNISKILRLILKEKINNYFNFNFYLGPGVNKNFPTNLKNIFFFKNDEKSLDKLIKTSLNIITNGGNTMFEMLMRKKNCLIFPSNKVEIDNSTFFEKKKIVLKYKKNRKFIHQINDLRKLKIKIKSSKYFDKKKVRKDFEIAFNNYL